MFGNDMFGINNTINNNPFLKSMRNLGNRIITGEYEVNEARPLGTNKVWFYSLALEPMEVRSERIIMLAEAYAIFGALFLSGTWVLYEWGSGYGYGGCRYEETSYCSPAVDRAFEVVMAMAITANLFQAMFSSMLWVMSILFSATHRNWVYGCRNLLGKSTHTTTMQDWSHLWAHTNSRIQINRSSLPSFAGCHIYPHNCWSGARCLGEVSSLLA